MREEKTLYRKEEKVETGKREGEDFPKILKESRKIIYTGKKIELSSFYLCLLTYSSLFVPHADMTSAV